MISLLVELILVVGVSVLAHAGIAYGLAPRKAKQGILDAITSDQDFQGILIDSVVKNLMSKYTDPEGKEHLKIDPLISRAMDAFKSYVQAQQKEIEKSAGEFAEMAVQNPDNPMLAMVLSQVPKKYRWLLPFVAQFLPK